jgi:cell filamentation protein
VPNYTYPDSDTLKNELGATSHDELERLESAFAAMRESERRAGHGPRGQFDADHLKALHHHLFQDVYEWAGHSRDERVTMSDGLIASEPVMRKVAGKPFLAGPQIADALEQIGTKLRDANYLRGLPWQEFAIRAATVMADLNSIHAFREGNGRTQRAFICELAEAAGHSLDFSVISQERMVQASVAAHERDDNGMMERLFNDAGDPQRAAALREAIAFLEREKFPWNDRYIAIAEPGYAVDVIMVGVQRDHFMARTGSEILIGNTSDLPNPHPARGEEFSFLPTASKRHEQQSDLEERKDDK